MRPPSLLVIDDFLPPGELGELRATAWKRKYKPFKYGGLVWPDVSVQMRASKWEPCRPWPSPWPFVEDLFDYEIRPRESAFRAYRAGQDQPTQFHRDPHRGQAIAILYLNEGPCAAGTSLWFGSSPRLDFPFVSIPYQPNRLLVFPATFHHGRILPGGWGTTPKDSRLLWVGFFDFLGSEDLTQVPQGM